MCVFIAMILPAAADAAAIKRIVGRARRPFRLYANPHMRAHLLPGERYFVLTGSCDCSTWLASEGDDQEEPREPAVEETARSDHYVHRILRRVGRRSPTSMTPTKWKRIEEEAERLLRRRAIRTPESHQSDFAMWRDMLAAIAASRATPYVGFIVHSVGNVMNDHGLHKAERVVVRAHAVDDALLLRMNVDRTYVITYADRPHHVERHAA